MVGLVVSLSGCAYLEHIDWAGNRHRLTETQLRYVHFLRWGEYEAASMIAFGARCNFGDQLHPLLERRQCK